MTKILVLCVLCLQFVAPIWSKAETKSITVGSKNFTESRILAELMAILVEEKTDLQVRRRFNLGGTVMVLTALRNGEIDLYSDYTGTGWYIHLKLPSKHLTPLETYSIVRKESLERFQIQWLLPFGFDNSYGFVMQEDRARELGIETASDLRKVQTQVRLGMSHEFLNRSDGFPAFVKTYDLKFKNVKGIEHGLAYDALMSGQADIVDTYTTDGKLKKYPLKLIRDDRQHFPPYQAVPLIRSATLQKFPEVGRLLNGFAYRITNEQMQELNFSVEEGGLSHFDAARKFLLKNGFLSADASATKARAGGLMHYFWREKGRLWDRVAEHVQLTFVSTFLAILIAVPLGVFLARHERSARIFLGATGVIQTVPSLALLALMIPLLGLGPVPAIFALFLYALLPILRNAYTGIRDTDPELVESAYAMGLTPTQVLLRIQLPLATPTLMAGIRTAAVIAVGIATLAAFVGAGGLGEPILTGLQLNDMKLVLVGAIPAAFLALMVDSGLSAVEKTLTPRGVRLALEMSEAAI